MKFALFINKYNIYSPSVGNSFPENSLDTTSEIDGAVLAIIKSLPRAWKKQTDKDVLEIEKLYTNIYQPSLLDLAKVENGESLTEVVEDVLTPDEKRELETAGSNLLGLESVLSVFPVAFRGILDGVARIMESQKKVINQFLSL